MRKGQVRLSDLAMELGISTATVSRALKDYPDISAETKQRVLALAKKLNYRPNSIAASLRKQESKIIGVIIPSIVNHFFSSVIQGIMSEAYVNDYRVMLCQSDESYEKEIADTNALYNSRVDGLLVSLVPQNPGYDHFELFAEAGIPFVFFDKIPLHDYFKGASRVVVDDYQGAYTAVTHLLEQGCKKIAHFQGPDMAYTSANRLRGYLDAIAAQGLPHDPSLIYSCNEITFEEGQIFAKKLFERHPDCDGIFTITDYVGMGAIDTIKKLGKKIPEDVAVIGFSDWKISSIIEPKLSSIAQPSFEMGQIAIRLLLQEIEANRGETKYEPQTVVLKTTLKARSSSVRSPLPTTLK